MDIYPLLFTPIYKKMVWGSESWDISCRTNPNEMSVIENGAFAGLPFDEVIAKDQVSFLGSKVAPVYANTGFPLLVKIIDTKDNLSVQVHPDDAYAKANGYTDSGKSEMWYIIEAEPNAYLIAGLTPDATPDKLRNDPISCLNKLPVKKGDLIDIPAGLVHAITKNIKLAEIQQNSDITFRLYDYDRPGLDGKPRELHIDEGIAVTNFTGNIPPTSQFNLTKYEVNGEASETSYPESFTIFTCVEGSCTVAGVPLTCERSIFIPAALGTYVVCGNATLLKAFM